jgi:hypothetical protein
MDVTYPGKGRGIKDRDDRWRVIEILMTDVLAEIKPTDPFKLGKQSVPGNTTDLIPPTVQYPNRLEVHMMYEFIQNSRCILVVHRCCKFDVRIGVVSLYVSNPKRVEETTTEVLTESGHGVD